MHPLGKLFEHNTWEPKRGILEDITKFLKDAPRVLRELLKIADRCICLKNSYYCGVSVLQIIAAILLKYPVVGIGTQTYGS